MVMKSIPKIFALVCVLAIVFSMSACVFADTTDAGIGNSGAGGNDFNITFDNGNVNVSSGNTEFSDGQSGWTRLYQKYRTLILAFCGIGTLTLMGALGYNLTMMGVNADNANERSKHIRGIIFCGIGAAGLGSIGTILFFFYTAL